MARQRDIEFSHGDRVSIGFGGPVGTVMKCTRKDRPGHYWKVKLDDGSWVWPEGAVALSSGEHEHACRDCGIPFRSNQARDPICPNCNRHLDRPGQPGGPSHAFGARRRR